MLAEAQAKCKELNIELPLTKEAGQCSVGQQQMTEILRVLMLDAKVVIMDEPSAALTERETETLFRMMRQLKAQGEPSYTSPTGWKKYSVNVMLLPLCAMATPSAPNRFKKQRLMKLCITW